MREVSGVATKNTLSRTFLITKKHSDELVCYPPIFHLSKFTDSSSLYECSIQSSLIRSKICPILLYLAPSYLVPPSATSLRPILSRPVLSCPILSSSVPLTLILYFVPSLPTMPYLVPSDSVPSPSIPRVIRRCV